MNTITVGVDLAKLVFSICKVDAFGHVLQRKDMKRGEFEVWLAQLPAGTVLAMEACSGAHHWSRRCIQYGLVPRLMAAKLVKPFRKSQKTNNDRNDAEAIATAARQGNMRFVPVKSVDQQARLAWHRVREGYKAEGLTLSNRLRGLLAEVGVVVAKGDRALRAMLGDTTAMAALPTMLVEALEDLNRHWQRVCERLAACDHRIGCDPGTCQCRCTLQAGACHYRCWSDHSRCDGGHGRHGARVQEWSAVVRLAGHRPDATLQRRT
jgi:transposase